MEISGKRTVLLYIIFEKNFASIFEKQTFSQVSDFVRKFSRNLTILLHVFLQTFAKF
jgi:hypothetical protein